MIAIVGTVAWARALIDCAIKEPDTAKSGNDKILWSLIIMFGHFVAAHCYVVRRPQRIAKLGR